MNNLSKTNDALRMIMEPNMEIGISYLMRRLNCIATGNVFSGMAEHISAARVHARILLKRIIVCLTNNNMATIHNGNASCTCVFAWALA